MPRACQAVMPWQGCIRPSSVTNFRSTWWADAASILVCHGLGHIARCRYSHYLPQRVATCTAIPADGRPKPRKLMLVATPKLAIVPVLPGANPAISGNLMKNPSSCASHPHRPHSSKRCLFDPRHTVNLTLWGGGALDGRLLFGGLGRRTFWRLFCLLALLATGPTTAAATDWEGNWDVTWHDGGGQFSNNRANW